MITLNDFRQDFTGKKGENKTNHLDNYTKNEFKSVKEIILNLLETDERARNDDKYLTYLVMQKYTDIYINFDDFEKIPAFETIKRCRALIQNKEGKFPPTSEEVIKKRKNRQQDIKGIVSE